MPEELAPGFLRIETENFLFYIGRETTDDGFKRSFGFETEDFQFGFENVRSDTSIMGMVEIGTQDRLFAREWDFDIPDFLQDNDNRFAFTEDYGLLDII